MYTKYISPLPTGDASRTANSISFEEPLTYRSIVQSFCLFALKLEPTCVLFKHFLASRPAQVPVTLGQVTSQIDDLVSAPGYWTPPPEKKRQMGPSICMYYNAKLNILEANDPTVSINQYLRLPAHSRLNSWVGPECPAEAPLQLFGV